MKVTEKSVKQASQQAQKAGQKKLGLRDLVKVEARVRSGCTKSFTNDCGINYRSN